MSDEQKYPILSKVNYPSDIRQLSLPQLKQLCTDIREYMVDTISEIGGHFGGGLGAVELTVAIHKVFNTPHDLVVWRTPIKFLPEGKKHLIEFDSSEELADFSNVLKVSTILLVQGMLLLQYLLHLVWQLQKVSLKLIKKLLQLLVMEQ